jgi:hypothetical protein
MRHFLLKWLVLIVSLVGIAFQANAQSADVTLVVTTTDGMEQTYQLTEESQLYFENGEILVIEDGNSTITLPLSQIHKIVCAEVTGTSEHILSKLQLFPNPSRNSFLIFNLTGSHHASIYSLDGRLVKSFEAVEGQLIDISELAPGMYLLHIENQTFKIMKL